MIIVAAACVACSTKKSAVFIARDLPNGIEITNFTENYDAYKGDYSVSFVLKNNTDKKLSIPSVKSDFYVKNKMEGTVDGGATEALNAGGSGNVTISTILPKESADSVLVYFTGVF